MLNQTTRLSDRVTVSKGTSGTVYTIDPDTNDQFAEMVILWTESREGVLVTPEDLRLIADHMENRANA